MCIQFSNKFKAESEVLILGWLSPAKRYKSGIVISETKSRGQTRDARQVLESETKLLVFFTLSWPPLATTNAHNSIISRKAGASNRYCRHLFALCSLLVSSALSIVIKLKTTCMGYEHNNTDVKLFIFLVEWINEWTNTKKICSCWDFKRTTTQSGGRILQWGLTFFTFRRYNEML